MARGYVFSDLHYAYEYLSYSQSNLVANSVLGPFITGNYSPFCGRRGANPFCAFVAAVLSAVCKVGVWGAVGFSPRGKYARELARVRACCGWVTRRFWLSGTVGGMA